MIRIAAALLALAVLSACAARGYDRGPVTPKPLGKYEEPEITDEGVLAALTRTPAPPARNRIVVYFDDGSIQNDLKRANRFLPFAQRHSVLPLDCGVEPFQHFNNNSACPAFNRLKAAPFTESLYGPSLSEIYSQNSKGPLSETYYQSAISLLREFGKSREANLVVHYNANLRLYIQQTLFSVTRLGLVTGIFFPLEESRLDLTAELTVWDISSDALVYAASQTASRHDTRFPGGYDPYSVSSLYMETVDRLTEKSLPGIAQALATGKPRSEYFSSRR